MYTIYSANRCQYCEMAKGLLKYAKVQFIEVNIDKNTDAKQFILSEGHRSVPQLYLNKEHIASGFEQIERFSKSVKL